MTEERQEEPETNDAIALSKRLQPLLVGQPAPVVGGALADLVSLLIAGHVAADSMAETKRIREDLLREHVKAVKRLIPLQDAMLREKFGSAAFPPRHGPN